ncbi:hypothetical protein DYB37_009432 [Aphanomyces astaci]|uniref:Protein kinase domain-containing protein n=1 Tax=Aphanomyces astaci TaxID=112090 RepID=A0A418D486_APHAT|nr:hypothetical protein DYB35_007877 [Aphanomyces astaci]RHZ27736.1 hypothetical protein DYB37_009432 [Aphanomyces astaci]
MADTSTCRAGMDGLMKEFRDPKTYYNGCPDATLTMLDKFKVDMSVRNVECQNPGCWWAYLIVARFVTNDNINCPITDVSTNSIVPPGKVNCTAEESKPPPGPTRPFDPTPLPASSTPSTGSSATDSTSPLLSPTSITSAPLVAVGVSSTSSVAIVVIVAIVVVGLLGLFIVWRLRVVNRDNPGYDYFRELHHNDASKHGLVKQASSTARGGTASTDASMHVPDGEDDLDLLSLWRIPPAEIVMEHRLAEGAFGQVWRASYCGDAVAVKVLHKHKSAMADIRLFIDEIKLVAKMDCNAIVQFVGVTYHRLVDLQLVTEFMAGGDLRTVLQESDDVSFPTSQKLECAIRIADALAYLHVMEPKVLHRDLKSRNVLMDPIKGAKVTDFGVSREAAFDQETLTQGVGTYRWMAPEVLVDGHYSTSADMFSFGIILTELDTHQIPYADRMNANGAALSDTAIIAQVMRGTLRPSFRPDAAPWFVEFASKCLENDPVNRPTAMEAAYFLRMALRSDHGNM